MSGNNKVRLTKDGKGTFSKIMKAFHIFESIHYPLEGFSVTITDKNFFDLNEKIIDLAIELGVKEVRIDIDVIGMINIPVTEVVKKII